MIPRNVVLPKADRDAGYYWELPDGTKQNRCPRHHLKEDPEWWQSMILTYNAYEKGFLPGNGGIDQQPTLLVPLMATISSAISDEDELEQIARNKKQSLASKANAQAGGSGTKGATRSVVPKRGR